MKVLILTVLGLLTRSESSHVTPLGVTVGISPHSHPISSLYHSQDVHGQYVYGYSTPTSSKAESKTADGVTQGGYSYIDSNGLLQTVQYLADPVHGFRVAATSLPQDLPEVALAKARHLEDFAKISADHANLGRVQVVQHAAQPVQDLPEVVEARARHLAILEAAYHGVNQQPVQDLPEVVKSRAEHLAIIEQTRARDAAAHLSPVQLTGNVVAVQTAPAVGTHAVVSSQYHAQDELGQYSYGYVSPLSSKSEVKTADGVTRGGYSYIDANGVLQTVNYVSDSVNGFRVAATNLPAAPIAAVKTITPQVHTQEIYY